jgi:hypothetical protein
MRKYSVEIRGKPLKAKLKCEGATEDFTSISNAVDFNKTYKQSTGGNFCSVTNPLNTM